MDGTRMASQKFDQPRLFWQKNGNEKRPLSVSFAFLEYVSALRKSIVLVLIRVFHTICWIVFNVPLMQLREFFLVRYYLSLQLTTDLELAKSKSFLFERNSTIALPSAALPYLYSWAGVDCLNMSYGPSSLPHGNLSFPAILCLSWSEGFRFFPLSLRMDCDRWDQKRAWTALFGLQLAYDWRLLKEKKRKGGAKKGLLPILNKGLERRQQPRTREKWLTWMGSYPITLTSGDREG